MHLLPPGPSNDGDMILNAWIAIGIFGLLAQIVLAMVYIC
jgi:hypothetical protein